jgi:DNA-binding response OmpR family regulator
MKILIVEDEIALQQSIASYLTKEDNICETASNFNEGSLKSSLYEYDII